MKFKKIIICLSLMIYFCPIAIASLSAGQTVSATLTRATPTDGGGAATNAGGIVAGGVVGGTAVSGATALAFAPLLLAGLEPNGVICAAAPLNCVENRKNFLQLAIKEHNKDVFLNKNLTSNECHFYFAQNDCDIINGTYDVDEIKIPNEFQNLKRIKINITIASQPYGASTGKPDFTLGIYKDITRVDLNKKFETQQFLHHYLMKKYEIPLKITSHEYTKGIQKLSGYIYRENVTDFNTTLKIVVRYTNGGFHMHLKKNNPKSLTYAYLVEFSK